MAGLIHFKKISALFRIKWRVKDEVQLEVAPKKKALSFN